MSMMLIDQTKDSACKSAEADAIRAKTGGSAQLAYDWANNKGFADAIAAIPTGTTPTGTKQISINANGTTTEDVAAYASAEITVNVPSAPAGLTLLGSGTYTKASDSANIAIPVTFTGTPKEYFYYNTTPAATTQQTLMGYNRVLDNSDFASLLPSGELVCAHRVMNSSGVISWSSSPQVITLTATQMSCARPGAGNTQKAGTWKWYIYGEAAT